MNGFIIPTAFTAFSETFQRERNIKIKREEIKERERERQRERFNSILFNYLIKSSLLERTIQRASL